MADYDASSYRLVDVADVAGHILGGNNVYPKRAADDRSILRVEDVTYLLEGLNQRYNAANRLPRTERGLFMQKPTLALEKAVALVPTRFMIQDLFYNPLPRTLDGPHIRNLRRGFVLKKDWRNRLFQGWTANFQNIVNSIKDLVVSDEEPWTFPEGDALLKSTIHEGYEKMRDSSLVFIPMWNGERVDGTLFRSSRKASTTYTVNARLYKNSAGEDVFEETTDTSVSSAYSFLQITKSSQEVSGVQVRFGSPQFEDPFSGTTFSSGFLLANAYGYNVRGDLIGGTDDGEWALFHDIYQYADWFMRDHGVYNRYGFSQDSVNPLRTWMTDFKERQNGQFFSFHVWMIGIANDQLFWPSIT